MFSPFDFATAGGLVKETENKSALGEEFLAEFSPEIRAFFRDPIEIKVEPAGRLAGLVGGI